MLKKILAEFYEMIDQARGQHGGSAPRITDAIIKKAFPNTVAASEEEGCDGMLRNGVKQAVASYIRKPPEDPKQGHFSDVDERFLPLVNQLQSSAYYVPSIDGGEYVHVNELIALPEKLRLACNFMEQKANETAEEAKRLRRLLRAVETA